jgi:hypothetical protein
MLILLSGLTQCSIRSFAQTDSSRILTDDRIKAIKILAVDARNFKEAYGKEHILRLADSADYTRAFHKLQASNDNLTEALKICQAEPKTTIEYNSKNWYWYVAAGSAGTAIIYFVFKLFIIKK